MPKRGRRRDASAAAVPDPPLVHGDVEVVDDGVRVRPGGGAPRELVRVPLATTLTADAALLASWPPVYATALTLLRDVLAPAGRLHGVAAARLTAAVARGVNNVVSWGPACALALSGTAAAGAAATLPAAAHARWAGLAAASSKAPAGLYPPPSLCSAGAFLAAVALVRSRCVTGGGGEPLFVPVLDMFNCSARPTAAVVDGGERGVSVVELPRAPPSASSARGRGRAPAEEATISYGADATDAELAEGYGFVLSAPGPGGAFLWNANNVAGVFADEVVVGARRAAAVGRRGAAAPGSARDRAFAAVASRARATTLAPPGGAGAAVAWLSAAPPAPAAPARGDDGPGAAGRKRRCAEATDAAARDDDGYVGALLTAWPGSVVAAARDFAALEGESVSGVVAPARVLRHALEAALERYAPAEHEESAWLAAGAPEPPPPPSSFVPPCGALARLHPGRDTPAALRVCRLVAAGERAVLRGWVTALRAAGAT